MTWTLSRFRAGELVEVRSEAEILATLDDRGCLDGMPFMPEMLRFCGCQARVGGVAHKTCDTVKKTGGRKLSTTVHLAGLRCDGSAHGGCQAECFLFWKDAWLKPANVGKHSTASAPEAEVGRSPEHRLSHPLETHCTTPSRDGAAEPQYVCQATQLNAASELLLWWNPRQYFYDWWTGNRSFGRVAKVLFLASLRGGLNCIPVGYRVKMKFSDAVHRSLTGRPTPITAGKVKPGEKTPTGKLGLKVGELVRVKPQTEIETTVNVEGKNRGLSFDAAEMGPFCGRTVRVRSVVHQIIEEPTGKMIRMKEPCIILEGVVCNAESSGCRLNCPREIPSYWRELWLERVAESAGATVGADQKSMAEVAR